MICTACVDGRESECWGITKHKTWCDWQGLPHDTVILQAQFCKHLRAANNYCPTCGTVFDDTQDRNGGDTTRDSFSETVEAYDIIDSESQRDVRDNFVPTAYERGGKLEEDRDEEDGPGQNNFIY